MNQQTIEFLNTMMASWVDQLSDKFPLPAEQRCQLVRASIAGAMKLAQPEAPAATASKPGPKPRGLADAVAKVNGANGGAA